MCQEILPAILCIMGDEDALKDASDMYKEKSSVPMTSKKFVISKIKNFISYILF